MNDIDRQFVMQPGPTRSNADGLVHEPKRLHQPKAALCRMLAILWLFPSAGAALILAATEAQWRSADNWAAGAQTIRLEQWIALVVLLAHPVFAWLAWHWRRTEPLREIEPDPDADLQDPT